MTLTLGAVGVDAAARTMTDTERHRRLYANGWWCAAGRWHRPQTFDDSGPGSDREYDTEAAIRALLLEAVRR